jgi:hypothetical protein
VSVLYITLGTPPNIFHFRDSPQQLVLYLRQLLAGIRLGICFAVFLSRRLVRSCITAFFGARLTLFRSLLGLLDFCGFILPFGLTLLIWVFCVVGHRLSPAPLLPLYEDGAREKQGLEQTKNDESSRVLG